MATILLSTIGTVGDILPFIRLGRVLQARGQAVTLFTHSGYADLTAASGLDFVPMDTLAESNQLIADGLALNNPIGALDIYRRTLLPKVSDHYRLFAEHACAGETIIVAHYHARLAAHFSAEKLGAPFVLMMMTPSQPANLPLLEVLLRKLAGEELNRIRGDLGLPPIQDWGRWLKSPDLSLTVWPEWLEPAGPQWPTPVAQVGFLIGDTREGDIPAEAEAMLAADPPPVLVTGGTGLFVKSDYYLAALEGVQRAGRRGLLVSRVQTYVPEVLPDNFIRLEFLPYAKVLPRVGAMIHHGGMGTCVQALMAGCPQLMMALGHDRPENAARFQKLGVAEFLPPPRWQPAMVADALHRLLDSPEVQQRCQALAQRARQSDGLFAACDAIESLAANQPPVNWPAANSQEARVHG